ncbi:hypothetical protein BY996DRAFT_6420248 [Phakopsora pachyrhizi]|nr:hypothetical protein BY996DRAFT_6420248 [Phakopsora pachyrhizi]
MSIAPKYIPKNKQCLEKYLALQYYLILRAGLEVQNDSQTCPFTSQTYLIWPNELNVHGSLNYPKVQKYCLMSVARCWTDSHVDFAGSLVFYHILRGMKVFYCIRPTVANLSKYKKWLGNSELQESTWLEDQSQPTYSAKDPSDQKQYQSDEKVQVPIILIVTLQRTMENDKKQDLDNQTQGHKDLDNVEVVPDWVLSGLLTLSGFLINQSEDVETDVKDLLSFLEACSIIKENLNCDQQLNSKLYPIAHELNQLINLSLKKLPTQSSHSTLFSNTNGKRDLGEIIFRSNEVPSTKVDIQHQKVPKYEADWEKKENEKVRANGKEEDVEGVEVRTTRAQNKVVRRYLDNDGRMAFEVESILNK